MCLYKGGIFLNLFDSKLQIKYSFLFSFTLLLCIDREGLLLLSLLCALLHELGHLAALRIAGAQNLRLILWGFGIRIEKDPIMLSFRREALVLLMGAIFNLALMLLLFLTWLLFQKPILFYAAMINLILGTLNLLPVCPLDGGQLFCLFLSRRFSPKTALLIETLASIAVLIPLFTLGTFLLLQSRNFSLLVFCCVLIYYLLCKEK